MRSTSPPPPGGLSRSRPVHAPPAGAAAAAAGRGAGFGAAWPAATRPLVRCFSSSSRSVGSSGTSFASSSTFAIIASCSAAAWPAASARIAVFDAASRADAASPVAHSGVGRGLGWIGLGESDRLDRFERRSAPLGDDDVLATSTPGATFARAARNLRS